MRDERGAAMVIAILMTALMTAVATALITTTMTETLVSGAHRAGAETIYAADAALERSMGTLSLVPDWSAVLVAPPGNLVAPFDDGQASPVTPDGRRLDLTRLLALRQSASNGPYGSAAFGADSPRWRLYGRATFSRLLSSGLAAPSAYLIVWVADDGADGDGDPSVDSNGQIALFVDAFGAGGAHRAIEAAIGRAAPAVVRLLAWKEVH